MKREVSDLNDGSISMDVNEKQTEIRNKMRILMLNYEYPPLGGGASPVTKSLAKKLGKFGHQVDIVTMGFKNLAKIQKESENVTVYRVSCIRKSKEICHSHEMLSFLPSALAISSGLIKKNRYDILHSHFIIPTGIISYLLNKIYSIPYAVTIHGSDVPGYNPDRFNIMHKIVSPLWKKIVSNASLIISPSNYLAKMVKLRYPYAKVIVIPYGIDYDKFNHKRKKEKRILLTSRLFRRKGMQYFLGALKKANTSWKTSIAGEGPYKKRLVEIARKNKLDVNFLGWVTGSKFKELLERSEIYIFPSSHDNCPVALQEAMASGCAIIASRYSGTGEIIDGAGIKVDPKDTEDFANKLGMLIKHPKLRRTLQRKSREKTELEYDWKRIVKKYMKAFQSVCLQEGGAHAGG